MGTEYVPTANRMAIFGCLVLVLSACNEPATPEPSTAVGESQTVAEAQKPAIQENPLKNAYFGELHLHTAYSLDAYIFGNHDNDPFVAYRFARGEEVRFPAGGKKRITKPLDFAAVTDHAEALGEYELCTNDELPRYPSEVCEGIRQGQLAVFQQVFAGIAKLPAQRLESICGADGEACVAAVHEPWLRIQRAANENYEPGEFTTFVAWEYSSNAPEGKGGMMHRNVIFRGDEVPDQVFSAFDGTGEDLQAWLETECTGDCQVLTIPHNPNFYWGRLYWGKNSDGSEMTNEIAERRARYDRLVEVMQIKGNSECQTGIGTTDEECDFETVFQACEPGQQGGCSDYNAFVRNGLKLGLKQQAERGINPFKQGIIGSTDNHNGTPSDTSESEYRGHYANNDGSPKVRLGLEVNPTAEAMGLKGKEDPTRLYNPGAIAGVWAESNTREAIWDALHRRETFGTSGTRTKIRLFAGFDMPADLSRRRDWVSAAYEKGVPQGGDLAAASSGQPLRLLAWAERDPESAPLARLQIVKGWLEGSAMKEMTYDVACSGGELPDDDTHRCPDNGATVDLDDCSIDESVGSAELAADWQDPHFDPEQHALYYARVIENPICRWSMYDAKNADVPHPADLPKIVKERAWSSPIWYTP